ncbi:MAG: OadG family protein [Oscillospiraceae bacterium]|nr:OadG family protein [Oscillospiraceae bacterium]
MDGTQIAAMTIVGLAVVFSALLILVIFLYLSGGIFKSAGKQKKSAPEKAAPAKPAPAAKPAAVRQPPKAPAPAAADDSEVIAVIMAAIAAMGAADGKQYKLHSVRQVTRRGSGRSVWAQAGLNDATKPF